MKYWLVKTEPDVYSIDDLKRDGKTWWTGVRNYQARNYLREMVVGDMVLIYHSNAEPPGVVGIGKVATLAQPDQTQFDQQSEYFEPKATKDTPRWFCPEIKFVSKLKAIVSLGELRQRAALKDLLLLQKGTRLSVIPVTPDEYSEIVDF